MMRASDSDVELGSSGASSAGSLSDDGATRPRQRKRQRGALKRSSEAGTSRRRQQQSDLVEESGATGNHARYVPWTKEEDDRLRQLVEQLGPKNWSNIAAQMNNRTSKSCRLRWLNQLRPNVQTGGFTPEEDLVIIDAQSKLGNKWTAIAAMLPGRTDNAVKNRWNSALRKRLEGQGVALPEPMQHDAKEQSVKREHTPLVQQAVQQQQQQQQQHAAQHALQQQPHIDQEQERMKQSQALFSQLLAGHPPELSSTLWAQGLEAGRQAAAAGARPLPTPPPSSTALVAAAPPFQLPLPFMTLQPQMSASEAAAMLAAANCDVLKKVTEATPMISATATVTSTAMVALAPPPAMMSMPAISSHEQHAQAHMPPASQAQENSAMHLPPPPPPLQQQPAQQQPANPLSTMRRVMSTHLAVKLLQQQQQHAPPPATMAMVASTPPPAVMAMPVADSKPSAQPPAVSWQLSVDAARLDAARVSGQPGLPTIQGGPGMSNSSSIPAVPGVPMVPSLPDTSMGREVSVKQEPRDPQGGMWPDQPAASTAMVEAAGSQQQQSQAAPAQQPQVGTPGLAHLLMVQQQVLQRQQQQQAQQQHAQHIQQHAQAQQQQQEAQHLQAQVPAQEQRQDQQQAAAMASHLPGTTAHHSHRPDVSASAMPYKLPATDAAAPSTFAGAAIATATATAPLMHVHSITASAGTTGLGAGAGSSSSGGSPVSASKLLASLLESSAVRSAVPSSLVRVVAAGGSEAVEHLLALGWGTLTAAAALRQQTHSSNTLTMAQTQTASHPSADSLLQWMRSGANGHGMHVHDLHSGMHAPAAHGAHASPVHTHHAQRHMLPAMQHQAAPDLGPCMDSIMQSQQAPHHHHHQPAQPQHHHQHSLLLDASPLGSMSDLMALCDHSTLADLERVAGSLSMARQPHPAGPDGAIPVDETGAMHAGQHDPDSPASLGQLLGSDSALHRFMQQPEGASSPNLTHLLEGFGDGADIVMHCATHG